MKEDVFNIFSELIGFLSTEQLVFELGQNSILSVIGLEVTNFFSV